MKTLRHRIKEACKMGGVRQLTVERDYVQSYVLYGLGATPELQDTMVLKGGTALRKIYFDRYRFSEDIDFSMIDGPSGPDLENVVCASIARAEREARKVAPLQFTVGRYAQRDPHPSGQEAFIVRVQFPWQRQPIVPVKIEVAHDEPVLLPTFPTAVQHGYGEPLQSMIRTYSLEEICSEKLRATQQTLAKLDERGWTRPRARDYYDLWHLARQPDGRIQWNRVVSILRAKCHPKGVNVESVDDIFQARLIEHVRASWDRTLGPFVSDLPPADRVIAELKDRLIDLLWDLD